MDTIGYEEFKQCTYDPENFYRAIHITGNSNHGQFKSIIGDQVSVQWTKASTRTVVLVYVNEDSRLEVIMTDTFACARL